jgi:hypothetical protein
MEKWKSPLVPPIGLKNIFRFNYQIIRPKLIFHLLVRLAGVAGQASADFSLLFSLLKPSVWLQQIKCISSVYHLYTFILMICC